MRFMSENFFIYDTVRHAIVQKRVKMTSTTNRARATTRHTKKKLFHIFDLNVSIVSTHYIYHFICVSEKTHGTKTTMQRIFLKKKENLVQSIQQRRI